MIKSERHAYTAKCRWREFVPSPPNDFQWKSKPYHMLSKVTEVQALRKAFPEHVSASGEDDYDDEATPTSAAAPDPEKAQLAVEWSNAVKAFADLPPEHRKTEADLLAHLQVARDGLELGHMEWLRTWYDELRALG